MIIVNNNRICSGALINNTCEDFIPYFLTADHCVIGQDVGNWTFRFQYKSTTCEGWDDYSYYSYYGATLQANSSESDFALLELNNRPSGNTGITYSGWSRSDIAPNSVVGIHHPAGDVMKISIDNEQPTSAWGDTHWFVDDWDVGTTEGGSSGSPLYDPNHRIIGQDHAGDGNEACDEEKGTYYGRFDISWTNGLSDFLDPNNTGVMNLNTIALPFISGSSIVCASNTTYSIQNRPTITTINWERSSNLSYVSGQGTNNYTVKASSPYISGTGWIDAEIQSTGCNLITERKSVWLGKPDKPVTSPPQSSMTDAGIGNIIPVYLISVEGGDKNLGNWSANGTISVSDPFMNPGSSMVFDADAIGYGFWYVNVSNNCGTSYNTSGTVDVSSSGGGGLPGGLFSLNVVPNPTTTETEAELIRNDGEPVDENITWEVEVYDLGMKLKSKSKKIHGKKYKIKVNSLKEGVYVIRAYIDDEIVTEKFIKK
jgi:V8-like Glu-specific endopeptidase